MKNCPKCNNKPFAELLVTLDPIVCVSARIKCRACDCLGPIFDQLESKSVKDLIQPAINLWNDWCACQITQIDTNVSEDLQSAISNWLEKNESTKTSTLS